MRGVGRCFFIGGVMALSLVFLAGISPQVNAQSGGSILGEVKYNGTPPAPKVIKVNKDNKVCGNEKTSEDLVVGSNKGIKWAVVSVVGVKGSVPKPAQKPAVDQKGCHFQPHVLLTPVGAEIDIMNSDGVLHNIHSTSKLNPSFNKAQPGFKKVISAKFEKSEFIKIRCDAHSWMSGWIVVQDSPYYAVTDANGSFKLENVPPGKHKIEVWHETLGKIEKEVDVKAGATTKVSFEMTKK